MKYRRHLKSLLTLTLFLSGHAAAETVVNTALVDQAFNTANQDDIQITNAGQLQMLAGTPNSGDALVVDSENATVTIDASNTQACGIYGGTGCAILTSGAGRYGINITTNANGSGTSATIVIGTGSSIVAGNDALHIDQDLATVNNAGTIKSTSNAVLVTANGQGLTFSNTGTIIGEGAGAEIPFLIQGPSATLTNAGTIQSTTAFAALRTDVNFTSISNSGTIESTARALRINNNASGTISNSGIIRSTAGDSSIAALAIDAPFTGTITNSGIIETTSTDAAQSQAVRITNDFGTINNTGTIRGLANGVGVSIEGGMLGTLNNSGSITSLVRPAIRIGNSNPSTFTALVNTGTISSGNAGSATIENSGQPTTITGGFTNSGIIENTAGTEAITLGTASFITFRQNAGSVTGNITLAGLPSVVGDPVFIFNGGTITGNVSANAFQSNLLNLNGGTLTGTLTLGPLGDTVNLAGGSFQAINGGAAADIFNITGGDFTALDGAGGANVINASSTPTLTGTITNFQTFNVITSGSSVTTTNTITNLDTLLSIATGTSYTANGNVSGTGDFTNAGTFAIGSNSLVTLVNGTNSGTLVLEPKTNPSSVNPVSFNLALTGFTQNVSGSISPVLSSISTFGTMTVGTTGATLNAASTISPTLASGLYIPQGSIFTILQTTGGGTINTALPVTQPNSLTLTFTSQLAAGNTQLQLLATRLGYSFVVDDPNAFAIAQALDQFSLGFLIPDQTMAQMMGELDMITSIDAMNQAIDSLGPQINYAMVEASNIGMTRNFNSIQRRLDQVKGVESIWGARYKIRRPLDDGFAYGDSNDVHFGTWVKLFAEYLNADGAGNIPGYKGDAVGFALGMDWSVLSNSLIGVAGSANKVHLTDRNDNSNLENVESYQLTLYGFFDPSFECGRDITGLYVDGMMGIASNSYDNRRNVNIGNFSTSGFSNFMGYQLGAQLDTGYVFLYEDLYIAPISRFKYTYLRFEDYTENGASGLNLSVSNETVESVQAGLGVRLAVRNVVGLMRYYPEAALIYMHDFSGQGQVTVANFLGGGTAFATNGNKPGQNIIFFDLGLTAVSNDQYVFRGKYELEYRNNFLANAGFIELYHRWS